MAASTLNIGVSGLNAAQANLVTTGQNIANASTPGYTRQQVVQQANLPMYTGSGFLGQGVNVETVKRVYSQYLTSQVLGADVVAATEAAALPLDEKLRQAYFWIVNTAIISPHYDIEYLEGPPQQYLLGDRKARLTLPSAQISSEVALINT